MPRAHGSLSRVAVGSRVPVCPHPGRVDVVVSPEEGDTSHLDALPLGGAIGRRGVVEAGMQTKRGRDRGLSSLRFGKVRAARVPAFDQHRLVACHLRKIVPSMRGCMPGKVVLHRERAAAER